MDFEHHRAQVGEVDLHYVSYGQGDPVALIHGWPQTWFAWRHVMRLLGGQYRVVAPDLRGLGDSIGPGTGFDKRTMAGDIWGLMHNVLGYSQFHLVGHDWGGPVAYATAVQHPDAIRTLTILDVAIPGDGSPNISQGGKRWHHAFHQTMDLPERLVEGREDVYLRWFYDNYGHRPGVIPEEDVAEYLRCYRKPGAMKEGFSLYRALPQDIADNAAAAENLKLPMPVLALGGADSWGRGLEVKASLDRLAVNVRGGVIEQCGHWIPEEQPQILADKLLAFFAAEGQ